MIIYCETSIRDHDRSQKIIQKFPHAQIIEIMNYKNIFDSSHGSVRQKASIILATSPKNPVLKAPDGYGFAGTGYFFKTSLGCIYDCEYCYLKGMFKNDIPVYFVDYEYIQEKITETINAERKIGNTDTIWMYSSDYSDIQGMDVFSDFNETFIPFFEGHENVMMETRTKSPNIQSLMSLAEKSSNLALRTSNFTHTELVYSLNPQPIIDQYEKGTASLQQRIDNINTLLTAGWKVGIRIMPLMPIENFEEIYTEFIQTLTNNIDIASLHSVFIGGLMFTKRDYKRMRKKGYLPDMISKVDDSDEHFIRLNQAYRAKFYNLFRRHFPRSCHVCLDSMLQNLSNEKGDEK